MLEQLPESYRETLQLIEIQGLSQRVAAERLSLSVFATKSRVQRGRQKLQAMLLACFQVQLDVMGNVLDYKLKRASCRSDETVKLICCERQLLELANSLYAKTSR